LTKLKSRRQFCDEWSATLWKMARNTSSIVGPAEAGQPSVGLAAGKTSDADSLDAI
jgi:hypothetical protein